MLKELDQDGNGEIDFDEFLYCMTETERYLDKVGRGTLPSYCIYPSSSPCPRINPLSPLSPLIFLPAYNHIRSLPMLFVVI